MTTIRHHFAAVVVALGIAGIMAAPGVMFTFSAGYQGISMMGTDAESHYMARMQQVYDGFPSQGNTFLPDKNLPPIEPGLGEWLEANVGMLFHVGVATVELYGKFFLPLITALLIYAFVWGISASRTAGLLSMLFVMLGDSLVGAPSALLGLFRGIAPATTFLTYARPINPEISSVLLFGTLYFIYRTFFIPATSSANYRWYAGLVATGLLTGLSLYVSFYTFSFLMTFGLILGAYELARRNFAAVRDILIIGVTAAACAIPFLLNYRQLIENPMYAEASMRFGLIASHVPIFSVLLAAMLVVAFLLPKHLTSSRIFIAIGAVALFMLINQQIITGHELQSGHFHWYITKPLFCIASVLLLVSLVQKFVRPDWLKNAAYALIGITLLYTGILVQTASYQSIYPETLAVQAYSPVLAQLEAQPGRNVVWADRTLSSYISIYTHDDAPNSDYAGYYLVPQSYLIERLLLEYRLENVPPSRIREQLYKDRADISQRLFGVYWRDHAGSYAAIPDSYLDSYAKLYPAIYAKPLESVFADLGVTEVVWDTEEEPSWKLDTQLQQTPVTVGKFVLYQLTQ